MSIILPLEKNLLLFILLGFLLYMQIMHIIKRENHILLCCFQPAFFHLTWINLLIICIISCKSWVIVHYLEFYILFNWSANVGLWGCFHFFAIINNFSMSLLSYFLSICSYWWSGRVKYSLYFKIFEAYYWIHFQKCCSNYVSVPTSFLSPRSMC